MRSAVLALLLAAVSVSCAATARNRPANTAPAEESSASSVYLYLDPLPPDLDGLRASLSGVSAISSEGAVMPLDVRLDTVGGEATTRQRLLAAGSLPSGRYVGLEVELSGATMGREPGIDPAAIEIEPVRVEVEFTVEPRAAATLVAKMSSGAPGGGSRFAPVMTAGLPPEMPGDAVALAVVPDDDAVVVFHKVTGEVFDVLRTCDRPGGVDYDALARRAFVACEGDDTIEVFDLVRGVREQRFPLPFGDRPRGVALARDGAILAVANPGSSTVAFLDAPRLTERGRVDVAREPVALVRVPDEDRMVAFSREGNAVTLIDPAGGRALGAIATEEAGPVIGAFGPLDGRLFIVHARSPHVSVADLAGFAIESRSYVGPGCVAIAVDPRTGRLYLGRDGGGGVEIYDPASLLPIDRLAGAGDAVHLAVDPRGDRLYVAFGGRGEVRSYRLPVGDRPARTDLPAPASWVVVAGQDGPR